MLKGTIYITYDINLCLANLGNCKTIAVVDEPDMYNIPGKVGGSILLPPYEALVCLIDGDDAKFNSYYITYLCSDIIVHKFVNIIINALMVGTNIILLLDPDGPKFDMALKQYFMSSFGIYIGDGANQFQFDMSFIPVILNRLYLDDDMDKNLFLRLYPTELPFDPYVIQKLSYDSGIVCLNVGEFQNQEYFKIISNTLKNGVQSETQLHVSDRIIMLLVGRYDTIKMAYNILSIKNNVYVLNLSSANLDINPSSLFYVPKSTTESNNYDIEYANFIFNNTQQRVEFLYTIHELQIGNDVLIMIGDYPGMYEMAESLLKLIQSRYGYNGYIITNSDIENLDMFQSRFSVPGLLLFDQEKVELDEIFLEEERRG